MTLKNWNPNNLTQKNWSPNNWTPKNWSSNIWTPKNWSPRKLDSKKLEFVYLDSKKLESKKLSFWVRCFCVKTRRWKAGNTCIVHRRLRRRPSKWNSARKRPQFKVENLLKSVKKFSVVPPPAIFTPLGHDRPSTQHQHKQTPHTPPEIQPWTLS